MKIHFLFLYSFLFQLFYMFCWIVPVTLWEIPLTHQIIFPPWYMYDESVYLTILYLLGKSYWGLGDLIILKDMLWTAPYRVQIILTLNLSAGKNVSHALECGRQIPGRSALNELMMASQPLHLIHMPWGWCQFWYIMTSQYLVV